MNKQKGITLIALVVTIIVLIILAGISINLILGENGIITKATNAREATRAASVQEQKNLWQASKDVDEHTGGVATESLESLVNRLVEKGLLTEEEKDQILGNEEKGIEAEGKVTIGNKTIVFGSTAKTLVQAFKDGDIKVGDYLDYKPVAGTTLENPLTQAKTGVSAEQNYTVDMSTTWRVLGLNENGTELLITSGSPVKKDGEDPYLHLASAEGYAYCVETLNEISAIYHNNKYASETRSMTIKDVARALGITVAVTEDRTAQIAYKTSDTTKTPLEGFQSFYGQSYTYESGNYAPENYLGTGSVKVGDTVAGSAYTLIAEDTNVVDPTSPIYDVIFSGTTDADNYAKSYWLASPGVYVDYIYAGFGPGVVYDGYAAAGDSGLFYSYGGFYQLAFGVRPVVSLKSNITVDDVKPTTGEEAEWTTSAGYITDGELTKGKVLEEDEIVFTIDGITYVAKEGMSWETWLYSDYNTLIPIEELKNTDDVCWYSEVDGNCVMKIDNALVLHTSTIIEKQSYTIQKNVEM